MELKIFDLHADLENSEILMINKCLSIFLESYGQIFNAIGEKIQIDPILSARWMLVLCENDNLVGFSILRPHQLKIESWLDTKYFSALSVETKNNLAQAKKTLSIEWVTVHPAHQKKFSVIQPVDLLMGLSIFFAFQNGFDSAIGQSRTDLRADKIAAKFGANEIGKTSRYDIECAVMFCQNQNFKIPENKRFSRVFFELWNNRNMDLLRRVA